MSVKRPIPMARWGKDHWSTLLYVEHVCVDGAGRPQAAKMRHWPGRPLRGAGPGHGGDRQGKYPTRLCDGAKVPEHDDWDCVTDMIAEGLVEAREDSSSLEPAYRLTDRGWKYAHTLRRYMAEGGAIGSFDPQTVEPSP